MHELQLTIFVTPEPDGYVARCQEFELQRHGTTPEDARDNLIEAIQEFLTTPEGMEMMDQLPNAQRTFPLEYRVEPGSASCN